MKKKNVIGFILILSLCILSIYKYINIQQYSSVFNEINELSKIESGTVVSDLKVKVQMNGSDNLFANVLNYALESRSYKVRLESEFESDRKSNTNIFVSTNNGISYSKLTSVLINDKKIYVDVKQLLAWAKGDNIADYDLLEKYVKQFGLGKYALINLNSLNNKKEEKSDDLLTLVFKNLDISFALDNYKKDDKYGIKINEKNTEKIIDSLSESNEVFKKVKDIILKVNPTIDGEIKTVKNNGLYNSDFDININGKTDYMKLAVKTNTKVIEKNIKIRNSINESDVTDVTVLLNMLINNLNK